MAPRSPVMDQDSCGRHDNQRIRIWSLPQIFSRSFQPHINQEIFFLSFCLNPGEKMGENQ